MQGWKRLYSSLDMLPIVWSMINFYYSRVIMPFSTPLQYHPRVRRYSLKHIWGATLRKTTPVYSSTSRNFTKYQTSPTGANTNPSSAASELWTKSTVKGTLLSIALLIVKLCLKVHSNISACHLDEWKWLSMIASLTNLFTMRVLALDCFVKKNKKIKGSNYYAVIIQESLCLKWTWKTSIHPGKIDTFPEGKGDYNANVS